MSEIWTYFKNLATLFRQAVDPARSVVLRVWIACFAGGLTTTATFFCPWPFILAVGAAAVFLDYLSLQIVYAAADWFFTEGRHYEDLKTRDRNKPA